MILEILERTPAWVYVLFAALLYLGIVQARTRRIPTARVVVLPAALIVFSLYGVVSAFGPTALALACWGLELSSCRGLGGRSPSSSRSSSYATRSRCPLTVNGALRAVPLFAAAASLVYGLASGYFLARALAVRRAAFR